jgi:DNA-binding NtrC family response regulator
MAYAELAALKTALRACDGNRRQTAIRLGISRASLYNKLQQHGLSERDA